MITSRKSLHGILFEIALVSLTANLVFAEAPPRGGANLFSHSWEYHVPEAAPDGDDQSPPPIVGRRFRNVGASLVGKPGDGLGPLHNATSCAACHPAGGASGVEHNVTLLTIEPRSEALQEATVEHGQQLLDIFPTLLSDQGTLRIEMVVHDYSTLANYDEMRRGLSDFVPGGIPETWFDPEKRTSAAISAEPVIAGRHGEVDFYLSQRNTPPLFGMGLIDRIETTRLQQLANRQRETTQGKITGRVAGKFGGEVRFNLWQIS